MTLLRAHSVGELVVLIPHLLGYHPGRAAVLVALREGHVGPIARIDLSQAPPEAGGPEGMRAGGSFARDAESAPSLEALRALVGEAVEEAVVALAERGDAILLVAYEVPQPQARLWERLVREVADLTPARVDAAVVVRDGRWWHIDDDDSQGSPVPAESQVPAVADFVLAGSSPLPSSQSFVELLRGAEPEVGDVAARMRELRASIWQRSARAGLRVWSQVLELDREPEHSVDVVARAVVALDDLDLRDGVFTWLAPNYGLPPDQVPVRLRQTGVAAPRGIDRDAVGAVRGRLVALTRATPREDRAPLLTLLGAHAWQFGDGTVARLAAQEALTIDDGYRMASYLLLMIENHVRRDEPPLSPRVRRSLRRGGAAAGAPPEVAGVVAASRHARPAAIRYGANRRL